MPLWSPVTSGSYASGKLWTPDLTLSLMGRDFAQFFSPFSWSLASFTASGGVDEKVADVGVCFPDSWDGDLGYGVGMRLSLDFTIQFGYVSGGAWVASADVWLKIGTALGTRATYGAGGSGNGTINVPATVTFDAVQGALPVGPVTAELWINYDAGADTCYVSRAFTAGLTSWYGFRFL